MNAIEEFAEILVTKIRDEAIKNCDLELAANCNTPVAKRWRASGIVDSDALRMMISDVVDATIFQLLDMVDQDVLRLAFINGSGVHDLGSDKEGRAELGGWYMGSEGWRGEFSKERYVDDFSDLKLP